MDRIKTVLIIRNKEFELKPGITLKAALKLTGILSETVLATRNGELILEDELIKEGDKIILVEVISGG